MFFNLVMGLISVIGNAVQEAPANLVALVNHPQSEVVAAYNEVSPGPSSTPETATLPATEALEVVEPPPEVTVENDVTIRGTITIQGIDVPFTVVGVTPGLAIRVGSYSFTVSQPGS